MKTILLAAATLSAAALLPSCEPVNPNTPGSNLNPKPWSNTSEANAGEILEGAPQPPRR